MSRLNLREASLLDISGELSPAAREALMARISADSAAFSEYQTTQENFKLLLNVPIPEPSAAERKFIPALIKKALHAAMPLQKEAVMPGDVVWSRHIRLRKFVTGWMGKGLAAAAFLGVCALVMGGGNSSSAFQDQVARINGIIDRSAASSAQTASATYDQDGGEIVKGREGAASLTLAEEHDLDVSTLFTPPVPAAGAGGVKGAGEEDVVGSSSPPGSF